jgi:hypothetical protein
MVAMLGEKKETQEIKQRLAEFFLDRDIQGAKLFFLESLKKRPDIMMEASDIHGDLRLCMQLISTAEYEYDDNHDSDVAPAVGTVYSGTYLDKCNRLDTLLNRFSALNAAVMRQMCGRADEKDLSCIQDVFFSEHAVRISRELMRVSYKPS